jgi:hypothetical protein
METASAWEAINDGRVYSGAFAPKPYPEPHKFSPHPPTLFH